MDSLSLLANIIIVGANLPKKFLTPNADFGFDGLLDIYMYIYDFCFTILHLQ